MIVARKKIANCQTVIVVPTANVVDVAEMQIVKLTNFVVKTLRCVVNVAAI
jgi:hypothetical protein